MYDHFLDRVEDMLTAFTAWFYRVRERRDLARDKAYTDRVA